MRKLTRRERAVFILALLAGAAFFLGRRVLVPAGRAWRRIDGEIARKQKQIASDEQVLRERKRIEQDYRVFARSVRKDPGRGMTALLEEIESLARQSGVRILDIRPQSLHRASSREASVSIVTESAWEPLARFVCQIYQSAQRLQIERASLRRQSEETAILQGQWVIGEVQGAD